MPAYTAHTKQVRYVLTMSVERKEMLDIFFSYTFQSGQNPIEFQ